MKISLLEPIGVSREEIEALAAPVRAKGHTFVYYDTKTTDAEELKQRSEGCEVVMIANNPYPVEVVRASKALRMLNVAFTGIDHVGLEACRERGVMVCNAANYSNQTVAELAVGLTIGLMRHIVPADQAVRSGGTSAGLMGREDGRHRRHGPHRHDCGKALSGLWRDGNRVFADAPSGGRSAGHPLCRAGGTDAGERHRIAACAEQRLDARHDRQGADRLHEADCAADQLCPGADCGQRRAGGCAERGPHRRGRDRRL